MALLPFLLRLRRRRFQIRLDRRVVREQAAVVIEELIAAVTALTYYDQLVTIPVNMGADFVAASGLGDELNYVPVDKHTFLATGYDDVFALAKGRGAKHQAASHLRL